MGRYTQLHEFSSMSGPGDARPTAEQIIADENRQDGSLADKIAIVTGCTSGTGPETAKALHSAGMNVWCAGRSIPRLEKAISGVGISPSDPRIHFLDMDLTSQETVRAAASKFLSESGNKLNILVNNAGIMASPAGLKTADGHDMQFRTNHIGHFLFFMLVKDALLAASTPDFASRVVNLSSSGHRFGTVRFDDIDFVQRPEEYGDGFPAYGQSKTSNIWMANHIERLYGSRGLHAWSVHPGGVMTDLGRHNPEMVSMLSANDDIVKQMKSPAQGAATATWCAVARELEGQGGKYCEDCEIAGPAEEPWTMFQSGYAPWAFDPEGEKKLWKVSCELVGIAAE